MKPPTKLLRSYVLVTIIIGIVTAIQAQKYRIVGGTATNITSHPYQVSLQKYGHHFCGGVILSAKIIATSAHCLYFVFEPKKVLSARVGSTYRDRDGIVVSAESLQSHPGYTRSLMDFDIATVLLKKALMFGVTVQPISIIAENEEPYHGEMLATTGWGKTKDSIYDPLPTHLQELWLPVLDRSYCRLVYGNTNVTYNMICAGGALDKGPYQGDSGGPLVNRKNQLVGIVSYRHWYSPNKKGYPRMFTNLASPRVRKFLRGKVTLT